MFSLTNFLNAPYSSDIESGIDEIRVAKPLFEDASQEKRSSLLQELIGELTSKARSGLNYASASLFTIGSLKILYENREVFMKLLHAPH